MWLLEKDETVSYEALDLETGRVTFGGSLVRHTRFAELRMSFGGSLLRNARFGDLTIELLKKSRRFCRLDV